MHNISATVGKFHGNSETFFYNFFSPFNYDQVQLRLPFFNPSNIFLLISVVTQEEWHQPVVWFIPGQLTDVQAPVSRSLCPSWKNLLFSGKSPPPPAYLGGGCNNSAALPLLYCFLSTRQIYISRFLTIFLWRTGGFQDTNKTIAYIIY